ncbi:MAG: glutathione peroxidase [Anaerolineaceae bacterium]|nr:glutathione peroxidase [Anaerolineaceae bacterium]
MTIYDFQVKKASGEEIPLSQYQGQVLLIVNTASKCGFTPQYKGLESLYQQFHARGFEVLGFPCDQFAHQEPGSDAEIQTFCQMNYDVHFPVFAKLEVNGINAHPLYRFLKKQKGGFLDGVIKWNFTKFLVDRQGNVVARFEPNVEPETFASAIEKLL